MAIQNQLINLILRLITPEEIGEITSKHNGGRFVSLTELVNERVQKKIYRNFSKNTSADEESETAKILPFKKEELDYEGESENVDVTDIDEISLTSLAQKMELGNKEDIKHEEDENMSSFIMIEKARLKKSQQLLKQKEIIQLYKKTSSVDVEQLKGQENNMEAANESGVLVNKRHY